MILLNAISCTLLHGTELLPIIHFRLMSEKRGVYPAAWNTVLCKANSLQLKFTKGTRKVLRLEHSIVWF